MTPGKAGVAMEAKVEKSPSDERGKVDVTFQLPEGVAGPASVIGEFNGWNPFAHPLSPNGDGTLSTTITLDMGREYRFRYLGADGHWCNDPVADDYVGNEFGGADSVVKTDGVGE